MLDRRPRPARSPTLAFLSGARGVFPILSGLCCLLTHLSAGRSASALSASPSSSSRTAVAGHGGSPLTLGTPVHSSPYRPPRFALRRRRRDTRRSARLYLAGLASPVLRDPCVQCRSSRPSPPPAPGSHLLALYASAGGPTPLIGLAGPVPHDLRPSCPASGPCARPDKRATTLGRSRRLRTHLLSALRVFSSRPVSSRLVSSRLVSSRLVSLLLASLFRLVSRSVDCGSPLRISLFVV
jgi:hypothetical protein